MLVPRLGCLVTALLSFLVTARYDNAAAGLSIHGLVVLYVTAAAGLSSHGLIALFNYGTVC